MDFGLKGKRALVLGASRGLGAACARELALEGAEVIAVARNADKITAWAGALPVNAYAADLTDLNAVDALGRAMADIGIDILVNNAGGPPAGPAMGQAADAWMKAYQDMAMPIMALSDAVLPGMLERGFGRIITIGSSGVISPIPNLALSNGVRGALAGWSKTLASEVAGQGVTVNMILPGRIATDRVRELDEGKAAKTGQTVDAIATASRATIPTGRYGDPEEFGAVAAFLASTRASYITGSMIRVDGGMLKNL